MELTFRIEKKGEVDHIFLSGKINEDAEVALGHILGSISSSVVFNFAGVKMINSCGVRAWINFIREAQKSREIAFRECTPEIVGQINMIPNFAGNAKIESVYADYACTKCSNSKWRIFTQGVDLPTSTSDLKLSLMKCDKCGAPMEMEEIEEEFFGFVEH